MCGIMTSTTTAATNKGLDAIAHRGPDARGVVSCGRWKLGHVRMSVLDLDTRSDQPFIRGNVWLSYNGELWNYKELRAELEGLGRTFSTEGDTEVFAAALVQWGVAALPKMEGMFAAVWYDFTTEALYAARDRFGEVPLHVGTVDGAPAFCSELKGLLAAGARAGSIQWVPPGHVCTVDRKSPYGRFEPWYALTPVESLEGLTASSARVVELLGLACRERAIADVPVAVLLSGGIDSTAVAALLKPFVPGLVGYTAVHAVDSMDHRNAKACAEKLGIPLVEVRVPSPTAADLGETVRAIELHSKAQVEIGWACLHLARRLRADGFKVVFTGEGSDELWASYGNTSFHGIAKQGWTEYRKSVFVGQHRKNFARCNKVFMAHGVEARLPFLHTRLVEWGMGLKPEAVFREVDGDKRRGEKWHLRSGMDGTGLIPPVIAARPKQAFQDGAGLIEAAAAAVHDPARYYRMEFGNAFGGVEI